MDNWKVTQAKDNFDWHNDGLEEKFIQKLLPLVRDLIKKSEKIRVRNKANPAEIISTAIDDLKNAGVIQNSNVSFSNEMIATMQEEKDQIDQDKEDLFVIIEGPKASEVRIERKNHSYIFLFSFDDAKQHWISIKKCGDNSYQISLNMKHPFFSPLTNDKKFLEIMSKFAINLAIAEIESKEISIDGKIDPSEIRIMMNTLLKESLKEKKETAEGVEYE